MTQSVQHLEEHAIACFVSPHGFGHASRVCAVIQAVGSLNPACRFDLFTTVPAWFFDASLSVPFTYHPVYTDVGLVQKTAFEEDIDRTLDHLDAFLPFDPALVDQLARILSLRHCGLILCDISPLGIAVGRKIGTPTVLLENFTWDWIYAGYNSADGRLKTHIRYLQRIFSAADYHIQTEPVCNPQKVDLKVSPISRPVRAKAAQVREQLKIPAGNHAVLITTGGIPERFAFLDRLCEKPEVTFIVPGGAASPCLRENLVLLPHHSEFFHPDLVNACDAVVGKAGYSTIAEVYSAGVPFGYVERAGFPESSALTAFVEREMIGLPIDTAGFRNGRWLERLPELLAFPRKPRKGPGGSEQVSAFICGLIQ